LSFDHFSIQLLDIRRSENGRIPNQTVVFSLSSGTTHIDDVFQSKCSLSDDSVDMADESLSWSFSSEQQE
jgi:hypothetical protein